MQLISQILLTVLIITWVGSLHIITQNASMLHLIVLGCKICLILSNLGELDFCMEVQEDIVRIKLNKIVT